MLFLFLDDSLLSYYNFFNSYIVAPIFVPYTQIKMMSSGIYMVLVDTVSLVRTYSNTPLLSEGVQILPSDQFLIKVFACILVCVVSLSQ